MSCAAEALGVYPIDAIEPVFLIELLFRDCTGRFDIGEITQEIADQPQSNWQVPYDERILTNHGDSAKANPFLKQDKPEDWIGDVRVAFFFHYLDLAKQLKTPFGNIQLPDPTKMPDRLSFMEYREP